LCKLVAKDCCGLENSGLGARHDASIMKRRFLRSVLFVDEAHNELYFVAACDCVMYCIDEDANFKSNVVQGLQSVVQS
jgi:hypothetical protein